jgi:hypothetical protein
MIISHKHKFLVSVPQKTGSATLRRTLIESDLHDYIGGSSMDSGYLWQHASMEECKIGFTNNGWDLSEYFKFSMVRNPWKRYVSWLLFVLQRMEFYKSLSKEELELLPKHKQKHKDNLSRRFLGKSEKEILTNLILNKDSYQSFLCYDNGELAVDMVGKLENFSNDFAKFCRKVKINPVPTLKHYNKNTYKKPYTDYYDKNLIEMVAEKEKWAIDKFGYDFDLTL